MLRIGLTGGIGAGKSTVAKRLAELGAVIVDADRLAREVVAPGTDGLAEIVTAFGDRMLTAEGTLDRPAMGELVFADAAARARLNEIVHPRVAARTAELLAQAAPDAIVVHDVPLLVENGLAAGYHLVVVVHADEAVRVQRLRRDRAMTEEAVRARIASQATEAARRAAADVWLDNDGSTSQTRAAVDLLWTSRIEPFAHNLRTNTPAMTARSAATGFDPNRAVRAGRLIARLRSELGGYDEQIVAIEHVGATSVPGVAAPDVLELMLTVVSAEAAENLTAPLSSAGFPPVTREPDTAEPSESEVSGARLHRSADPGAPADLYVVVAGSAGS
ncbi:dephospho-CoA kinase [Actinoalloteichus hymeniacidonis]|uniref:Dephospho-CoA kinase n=1 Tax=Actinoalloteichus hymeniacidonis TaxID=340345 RepID=A0AAC9MYD1_9PSEU|nr:dephospho-CoA kinase [Actinoalloteichus hymeniacidonis]AOS62867.1 dephospho-CoA kinase [Actinoalloteichus hymeniacidonis]MBB5909100.1 dephospho-CoA kinase [Actinoalloteichus hymeniacidonis]